MIRLHPEDEEELRWWANCEHEGVMGRRSNMGVITDGLVLGGASKGGGFAGEVRDAALAAARRLRRVEARLQSCSSDQRFMLRKAFETGSAAGLRMVKLVS